MRTHLPLAAICCALLGACAMPFGPKATPPEPLAVPAPSPALAAPRPRPAARTAAEFDTTTPAQRAAAATPASGGQALGRTIAALGDPTEPGFWVRSPLVRVAGKGRLVDPASGTSVQVDLVPLPGDPGAGSQVSLPAFRVLGLPLTALPELMVYAD
ncbi:hypothetical protein CCR83_02310 [Rhodobacter veldkampii DSM 11550]|uniref:D-galactarate dehydratase n=1 Tax=Phaeovulum veldkampii DSM 11550 TaxID=1185920 RepID=A0A2T4JFL0_9RHOB|nr:hypothetical protein [Phaeovulum veldkampii]MBK5945309.1 hypothetical protein [Phaeovulum veldkampii DSM 11550]PTE16704.1 hypothetical protein C5F46_12910 [Phaeovulum veldkampii DSM 11550]TDQ60303.1 hypothetical protein EV658_10581 [Phaeovulum veldkampii DSM 11550]